MVDLLQLAITSFLKDPVAAIGNIVFTSYLIPLGLFSYRYARHSPWWKTELGIALLAQKVCFTLIFVLLALGYYAHDWTGRQVTRDIVAIIVGISLWMDVRNLTWYQTNYPLDRRVKRPTWRRILNQYRHPGDKADTGEIRLPSRKKINR